MLFPFRSRSEQQFSLEVFNIGEIVSNLDEFVVGRVFEGDHLHQASQRLLEVVYQGTEIPVAADQHDGIHLVSQPDRVHGDAQVPVALFGATQKHGQLLLFHLEPGLVHGLEEVDLLPRGLGIDHIGDGAHQQAVVHHVLEQSLEVDLGVEKISR